jgi:hypothetical protein
MKNGVVSISGSTTLDPTTHVVFGKAHGISAFLNNSCGTGVYTLPRLMTLSDDGSSLLLKPLPSLVSLHQQVSQKQNSIGALGGREKTDASTAGSDGGGDGSTAFRQVISTSSLLAAGRTWASFTGSIVHINALLPCSLAAHSRFFGVHILTSASGRGDGQSSKAATEETTLVGWNADLRRISLDRTRSSSTASAVQSVPYTGKLEGGCETPGAVLNMTVIVDGGMIEVRTGAAPITQTRSHQSDLLTHIIARGRHRDR